jgi:cutinase
VSHAKESHTISATLLLTFLSKRAQMVQSTLAQCPSTKIVMSGYSQGGQIVHNAAKLLPASTMAKVSSVLIFGDPGMCSDSFSKLITLILFPSSDFGQPVAGASPAYTKVICHEGDNICEHGDLILIPHLTYGENCPRGCDVCICSGWPGNGKCLRF